MKKKPIKYWLGKCLILQGEFKGNVPCYLIESWFNPESGSYNNKICCTGSTASRKWREIKGDYLERVLIQNRLTHLGYIPGYERYDHLIELIPKFNYSTNTWTLPPEFINWLKIYVKRWEG